MKRKYVYPCGGIDPDDGATLFLNPGFTKRESFVYLKMTGLGFPKLKS